jgi:hypothetical protein
MRGRATLGQSRTRTRTRWRDMGRVPERACVRGCWRSGGVRWALVWLLLAVHVVLVVAPPRVPSVGEWAGIRAMKFLKCRYYRYDRSGRDVCEGDSIEDLRASPLCHMRVICAASS